MRRKDTPTPIITECNLCYKVIIKVLHTHTHTHTNSSAGRYIVQALPSSHMHREQKAGCVKLKLGTVRCFAVRIQDNTEFLFFGEVGKARYEVSYYLVHSGPDLKEMGTLADEMKPVLYCNPTEQTCATDSVLVEFVAVRLKCVGSSH